jgi:lysophospholipase L1-like esterase
MHANRFGLRGPDFDLESPVGETRIAVLGASTIMGTYAAEDSRTSSAQLQVALDGRLGSGVVRVINAGVAGLTVGDQSVLLRERLLAMGVDVVIWYPGTNDLGCRVRTSEKDGVRLRTPNWLLTGDLLLKNTQAIRRSGSPARPALTPIVDLAGIAGALREGIQAARISGTQVIIVVPARSFSVDMPVREIRRRTADTLVFRPCFSAVGLAEALERYDDMLRSVATAERVLVIEAGTAIGNDESWFGDALHFSELGEKKFANVLFEELVSSRLLPEDRGQ